MLTIHLDNIHTRRQDFMNFAFKNIFEYQVQARKILDYDKDDENEEGREVHEAAVTEFCRNRCLDCISEQNSHIDHWLQPRGIRNPFNDGDPFELGAWRLSPLDAFDGTSFNAEGVCIECAKKLHRLISEFEAKGTTALGQYLSRSPKNSVVTQEHERYMAERKNKLEQAALFVQFPAMRLQQYPNRL